MCFSPQGDLAAGVLITGIGIDACRHLKGRNDKLLLASLPLLLGFHQIDESFVWFGLRHGVPAGFGRFAMWVYLAIALVVLPVFVPAAVLALERERRRRLVIAPFLALGAVVSTVLLITMIQGPVTVTEGSYHLAYSIGLGNGILVVCLYVLATCGSVLASSHRHIVVFGIANLIAVAVLARLTADGFASLWCLYAAIASGAIALHVRYSEAHRSALGYRT